MMMVTWKGSLLGGNAAIEVSVLNRKFSSVPCPCFMCPLSSSQRNPKTLFMVLMAHTNALATNIQPAQTVTTSLWLISQLVKNLNLTGHCEGLHYSII